MPEKKIVHVDMDCFFAAVEMRDNPSLAGKPVAVGGTGRRGVVATANYEARKYGVHSAISGFKARQLCPQLIFVAPNFGSYKADAELIRDIFKKYSPLVESFSIDEAYLDITDCAGHNSSATLTAQAIKDDILQTTGLTASAGAASNKFLAKVASDWRKPDGLTVITPAETDKFVLQLAVSKIPGVGKATGTRLAKYGIRTCGDLRAYDEQQLRRIFGKFGEVLHQRAYGRDDSPVRTHWERKSTSVEHTFSRDLTTFQQCEQALRKLHADLSVRIEKSKLNQPIGRVFIKIKFSDFSETAKQSSSLPFEPESFVTLLRQAHAAKSLPIRLLGVGVSFAQPASPKPATNSQELQLSLTTSSRR